MLGQRRHLSALVQWCARGPELAPADCWVAPHEPLASRDINGQGPASVRGEGQSAHWIEADAALVQLVGRHGREGKAGTRRSVSKHQHVRNGVQVQRVVEVPEDRLRLERHRAQVGLLQQRRTQVLKHGV